VIENASASSLLALTIKQYTPEFFYDLDQGMASILKAQIKGTETIDKKAIEFLNNFNN
jgi:hypothetical protein